jgi:hypothetical protein
MRALQLGKGERREPEVFTACALAVDFAIAAAGRSSRGYRPNNHNRPAPIAWGCRSLRNDENSPRWKPGAAATLLSNNLRASRDL